MKIYRVTKLVKEVYEVEIDDDSTLNEAEIIDLACDPPHVRIVKSNARLINTAAAAQTGDSRYVEGSRRYSTFNGDLHLRGNKNA